MTANSPTVPSSRAELPVVMWMIVFISIEALSREISGLIAARSTRQGDFSTPLRCGRNDVARRAMANHRHRIHFWPALLVILSVSEESCYWPQVTPMAVPTIMRSAASG